MSVTVQGDGNESCEQARKRASGNGIRERVAEETLAAYIDYLRVSVFRQLARDWLRCPKAKGHKFPDSQSSDVGDSLNGFLSQTLAPAS